MQDASASHRSALGKIDFRFQADSTQTTRRPFSCLYPGGESEPVNGDLSPSQHINHTLFKSPHPHPSGTHTKAALEGNENRSGAARTRMGWCREARLIIRVSLDKSESSCKSVFTCARVLTPLPGPRAEPDATAVTSYIKTTLQALLRVGYNHVQEPITSEGPGRGVTPRYALCAL